MGIEGWISASTIDKHQFDINIFPCRNQFYCFVLTALIATRNSWEEKGRKKSINLTYLLSPPLASSLITLILEHFPTESFWISLNSLNSFSDYGIVGLFCCGLILLTVNIKHLTDLNNTLLFVVKTFLGLLYIKIINTKRGFRIQTRDVGIYGLINSVRSLQW